MKYLSVAGDRVTIFLEGTQTAGAYTLMEAVLAPGKGPPPHVHHREDEGFLVMVGEVTFYRGDETIVLRAGEYLFAPREIPHHFKNTGSIDARVIETASPAGIEHFFIAAGTLLATAEDPAVPVTPEALTHMIAIAPKYGIEILV